MHDIFSEARTICAGLQRTFRLQTLVYLEDWENILVEFGRETLLHIQHNLILMEDYEKCADIETYL